jgi:hypothetical protein
LGPGGRGEDVTMASIHSAVALDVLPGREQAYLDWVRGCPRTLGPVYARTGIHRKVVLMAGRQVIAYYEADRPGAVEAAFATPEAAKEFAGTLGALLDPASAPAFFAEELCWEQPVAYQPRHVALKAHIRPGREAEYLDWARNGAVRQFDAVWRRAGIARKAVLVNGSTAIAYYHCRDSASVLDTFVQPEAHEAMKTNLGALLESNPGQAPAVFEEVFIWRRP